MAKRRFKFGDLKNLAKLADQFLDAGEHVHDQIKDKDAKEILDLLKNNVSSLKNPKTLFEVQRTLKGKSPKEIKEFFEENFKDLSSKDAADLAKALSEEKGLPGFLSDKLATKKPEETTPDKTAETKPAAPTETPAANENTAPKAAEKPAMEAPKKEEPKKSGSGLPWGKMLGAAWDVKQKIDNNRQKEGDNAPKKDENGQNNQNDTENKQPNNKGNKGHKPG